MYDYRTPEYQAYVNTQNAFTRGEQDQAARDNALAAAQQAALDYWKEYSA